MMSYKILTTAKFDKELKKLDNSSKILILKYLKRLEATNNPEVYAKKLTGNFAGLYRFRINNYRLIAKISNDELVIYALAIGHRSTIYTRF